MEGLRGEGSDDCWVKAVQSCEGLEGLWFTVSSKHFLGVFEERGFYEGLFVGTKMEEIKRVMFSDTPWRVFAFGVLSGRVLTGKWSFYGVCWDSITIHVKKDLSVTLEDTILEEYYTTIVTYNGKISSTHFPSLSSPCYTITGSLKGHHQKEPLLLSDLSLLPHNNKPTLTLSYHSDRWHGVARKEPW
eukprot:TRINITY_DN10377_c0_g1_i1.p1 TRINITY_DN10377_c0_g1~~TRINITY_DN10377_c0_g1_i1.p1  ORF type:complete len:188 (-),score=46.98 TRINITY_DN10377_c0_g1_i1:114-677(-)